MFAMDREEMNNIVEKWINGDVLEQVITHARELILKDNKSLIDSEEAISFISLAVAQQISCNLLEEYDKSLEKKFETLASFRDH